MGTVLRQLLNVLKCPPDFIFLSSLPRSVRSSYSDHLEQPRLEPALPAPLSPGAFNSICLYQSGAQAERQGTLSWQREEV